MKLQIPISEAICFVKTKIDKPFSIRILDSDTVIVDYEIKIRVPLLGEISKQIDINLQIEKILDEILYIRCGSEGPGIDLIVKGVLVAFPAFITSNIFEVDGERRIKVRLREIEKLHGILDKITINTISFENDCAMVDFSLKEL